MPPTADLVFTNARVITLDPARPTAKAVAVRGDRVLAVGTREEMGNLASPATRVLDCQGMALLPGFVDAHCHLLSLASSLTGVDCGPGSVVSLQDIVTAIRQRAARTPQGQTVRAYGYDDLSLAEGSHPDRHDLDRASPKHPVRLDHRSGHAAILNSLALRQAGIHRETPDPEQGVIVRDPHTGEPTGLLLEMAGFLRERLPDAEDTARFAEGVARLDQLLLGYGITSVTDAGPDNRSARWRTFQELKEEGKLTSRVTMMVGANHLDEFASQGLAFGTGDDHLRLGHAKVMLTMTTGALHPDPASLEALVGEAHRRGFPVAIHAVEEEAIAAAVAALGRDDKAETHTSGLAQVPAPPDRIEHCSEGTPGLLAGVKDCGATVVTQPGFVYWNGDRYLERVERRLLPHLYPVGALQRGGVPMAFGSDAPVADPNPWPGIYSAVTRRTRRGKSLPPGPEQANLQRVEVLDALKSHILAGARAEGSADFKGMIASGYLADLTLVNADPLAVPAEVLPDIRTVLTVLGGEVVWNAGL